MTDLTVGAFSPSVLLRVARHAGALDRRHLRVTEVPVSSSPAQFRALLAGDLDVALTSPDNVIAYRFVPDNPLGATADVRIISGVDRGLGLALFARPEVGAVSDLRGRSVGVDVAGSGFAFALYEIMLGAGLRAGTDYEPVELGSTPARLAALLAGRCAATLLNAGSDLRAEAAGMVRLASVTDASAPYLGTVLAVSGRPDEAARGLAAALGETADQLLAGRLRDVAVGEAVGAGLAAELAGRYVDGLAAPATGLVAGGSVDPAGLAGVLALRRRHAPAVVDGRDLLVDALDPARGLVDDGSAPPRPLL